MCSACTWRAAPAPNGVATDISQAAARTGTSSMIDSCLAQGNDRATLAWARCLHYGWFRKQERERTMGIFESGAVIPLWILGAPLLLLIADAVMTPKVKPREHYTTARTATQSA
jgi:hypothetical protein